MKTVFLYAYDNRNLGDDLFVHTITKRYPGVRFYLWASERSRETYAELSNLKVLTDNDFWVRTLGKLSPRNVGRIRRFYERAADAVVYIGGSIFIEYPNWRNILNWWDFAAENYPLFVLGANFGPYSSEDYRETLDKIFLKTQDVCFRDRFSKECFSDNPKVRCAPDILFSLPLPPAEKKKQAFFSIIDCEQKEEGQNRLAQYDADYVHFMAEQADRLIENGWSVVFSSFCKAQGDERGIDKVLRVMKNANQVQFCHYDGTNAALVLQTLAESRRIYATRFHAAILGLAAEAEVIPIVYSDKTIHVLEDISSTIHYLDIRNLSNDRRIDKLPVSKIESKDLINLSLEAESHFLKLDSVLTTHTNEVLK